MDYQDVKPFVGELFDVPATEDGEIYVQLTLLEATQVGKGHAGRAEPFELIFEGPSSHPLDQSCYILSNEKVGSEPIFIVPLSDNGTVRIYQAVFN